MISPSSTLPLTKVAQSAAIAICPLNAQQSCCSLFFSAIAIPQHPISRPDGSLARAKTQRGHSCQVAGPADPGAKTIACCAMAWRTRSRQSNSRG